MRTWRRLQQLGAVAVKQSVYVLPDSPSTREDLEWLRTEIIGSGGEATVFAADTVDAWSDDALVEEFRKARQTDYTALAGAVEAVLKRLRGRTPDRLPGRGRDPRQSLDGLRQRLSDLERIDFFGSPGRDRVRALLADLEERTSPARSMARKPTMERTSARRSYRRRLWVTRPRPGVDRMASAWLIRRFIDPDARFAFVGDARAAPADALPFDMFGAEFSHQGEHCTFETLCQRFRIRDPAVARIAAIVHDLDLKDGRFEPAEAPAIGRIVEGLQLTCGADDALLAQGIGVFEALFQSLARPRGRRTKSR